MSATWGSTFIMSSHLWWIGLDAPSSGTLSNIPLFWPFHMRKQTIWELGLRSLASGTLVHNEPQGHTQKPFHWERTKTNGKQNGLENRSPQLGGWNGWSKPIWKPKHEKARAKASSLERSLICNCFPWAKSKDRLGWSNPQTWLNHAVSSGYGSPTNP